jgi:hypothetical protein
MQESVASPACYARMASYVHQFCPVGVASDVTSKECLWGTMHATQDAPRECTDMRNVTR